MDNEVTIPVLEFDDDDLLVLDNEVLGDMHISVEVCSKIYPARIKSAWRRIEEYREMRELRLQLEDPLYYA